MALTVTAASAADHSAPIPAPSPVTAVPAKSSAANAAARPSSAATAGSSAQQQAALNQLLVKYTRDQSHGTDARTLSALGKQILAAAKALNQHVALPHAPGRGDTSSASAAPEKGKVNVTA